MSLSNWLEIEIMNHIFGKVQYQVASLYIGLGLNTTDADANELSDDYNYSRVVMSSAYWTQAANGRIVNALGIVMPQAVGAAWGTVTHFILFNSSLQTGQMLLYGYFDPNLNIKEDDIPQFNAGELEITLD